MLKSLGTLLLGLSCVGVLVADEPAVAVSGTKAVQSLEQRLQQAAELELGEAETITWGALLEQLQAKHSITVELHRNTLTLLMLTLEEGLISHKDLEAAFQETADFTVPDATYLESDVQYYAASPECPKCSKALPSAVPMELPGPLAPSSPVAVTTVAPPVISDEARASNQQVAEDVAEALREAGLSGEQLEIRCKDGTVSLVGHVENAEQAQQAEKVARSVPGVDQVVNQLVTTEGDVQQVEAAPVKEVAPAVTPPKSIYPSELTNPPAVAAAEEESEPATIHTLGALQTHFLQTEIHTAPLRNPTLTVEQLLRRALAQMVTPLDAVSEEFAGMPAAVTHAYDWDLLVDEGCVFITTRLQANLHKVTRVYRLPKDADLEAEEVAEIVRKTIRPWSWRSQIDDVVNMVEFNLPPGLEFPSLKAIKKINLTGEGDLIELTSAEEESSESPEESETTAVQEATTEPRNPAAELLAMQAVGGLLSSGTRAAMHGTLSSVEILHYADPPTGIIEVLPGRLVISQSLGAHREIKDLLEQLSAE